MERWQGRVALVTGASSGIGAELCLALVRHGLVVVGCARSVDKIKAIAEEEKVKISPGKLIAFRCDLSKESEILSMFKEIRQTCGRVDICINNAGLGDEAPLLTGSTAEFRNMLDVNVMALCICTQQSFQLMQEKGIDDGQIIHISSMLGHKLSTAVPGAHFYCGTKFMVRALSEGHRRELKAIKSRIKVSCISPGVVETRYLANFWKKDPTKDPSSHLKSFECLQPKEIADSVLYVLSTPAPVEINDILIQSREHSFLCNVKL
ncbi:dehydrogenase/reductase SDR family member 11-like [Argiope bruennichi]|uniref:dehydrogenase/reductase SDR family member 11-like n=1 Tax=Argiope bruennichi TaxID=94029 RepID=UPI0024943401|nr:dehydrogenase/reductase SDR family member 11-like [Argiope bruennichi]